MVQYSFYRNAEVTLSNKRKCFLPCAPDPYSGQELLRNSIVLALQLLIISVSVAWSHTTAEQFKWNFNSMSKQTRRVRFLFLTETYCYRVLKTTTQHYIIRFLHEKAIFSLKDWFMSKGLAFADTKCTCNWKHKLRIWKLIHEIAKWGIIAEKVLHISMSWRIYS